jgi:hypothetical protein
LGLFFSFRLGLPSFISECGFGGMLTASRRRAASWSEYVSSFEDRAMISCPFEYSLTDDELRKLGEMLMTWSHTEHTIGNCLKALLKFDDDEAIALVFPLSLDQRPAIKR